MPRRVADRRHPRGLIDTSVFIDLERIESTALPLELAVSAVTMAELAAGLHATADRVDSQVVLLRSVDHSFLSQTFRYQTSLSAGPSSWREMMPFSARRATSSSITTQNTFPFNM